MKLTKFVTSIVVALMLVGTGITPAIAKEEESFLSAPWRFHFNLYLWLPEAPVTIEVNDKEILDAPEDLDTILDSMDFASMFELEVHKGRVVLFVNNVYYKGRYDENFTGKVTGLFREVRLEEKVWAIKYGAGYQLGPWELGKSAASFPTLTLYPWFGAFYLQDDWEVSLSPGLFNKDGTLDFNTPMVGLSAKVNLSERWYLNVSYANGGWNVDYAKEVYDFVANIGYRFAMWDVSSKVFVGYRYLHVEYEKQPVNLNLAVKGPLLGIGWEF